MIIKIATIQVCNLFLTACLTDGRKIITPLDWYPKLKNATVEQKHNFRIIGAGSGVSWPDLDEDLSLEGMLKGNRIY